MQTSLAAGKIVHGRQHLLVERERRADDGFHAVFSSEPRG